MQAAIKNHLDVSNAFDDLPKAFYGDVLTFDVKSKAFQKELVDFVVVELRSGTAGSTKVQRRAGLLMADGRVVGFDGTSLLIFRNVPAGAYYVVVRHRNHLAVMSASKVDFKSGAATYNFTTSAGKAYGSSAQNQLKSGVYGLIAGDLDGSGRVDTPDVFNRWSPNNGLGGYLGADADLSGFVNALDLLRVWLPNVGQQTKVPN